MKCLLPDTFPKRHLWQTVAGAVLAATLSACGGGGGDQINSPDTAARVSSAAVPIEVQFQATVDNTPIQCGQAIPDLGSTHASGRLTDFRFYVSEVFLLRDDGQQIPMTLATNSAWQYTASNGDSVTLIDLEDGSNNCAIEGSSDTNALLKGSVPAGRYVGLRMTLGVPHSLNHTDTSKVAAPLDSMAMGWSWQAGRKFAKIEVTEATPGTWPVTSDTFYVHLGSTGCTGNAGLGTVTCSRPNRGILHFAAFDPSTQKIAVDLRALLADTDVTINQSSAGGCMSAATDADCLHVFEALAIDWRSDGTGTGLPVNDGRDQTVFKVVSK